MKKSIAAIQLIGTLAILAFVPGNLEKLASVLILWALTFQRPTRKELISFVLINVVFVISDIGAIQNGFFVFSEPDVLGLPYWEFVMWGFYLLHTARLMPATKKLPTDWKAIALAVVFSLLFGVIKDRNLLLALTTGVLVLTQVLYREREDFMYNIYLMLMGIAFETVGLYFNLWSYPESAYSTAVVQFVVMWGATGIFFRRILGAVVLKD